MLELRLLQGCTAAGGIQNGGSGCEGRVSGMRRRLQMGVVVSMEEERETEEVKQWKQ